MKYLISISYDGSNFYGFQRLNNNRSVQGELEKALTKIAKHPVLVKGAGRTDRGVHAIDQKCHFDLDINISSEGLVKAMNSLLPRDIYVNDCFMVPDDFHARFLVKRKTYKYIINMGKYEAIMDKYLYNFGYDLDINLMKKASKLLIGAHSYEAFVSGKRDNYNSIVYKINFKKMGKFLEIEFIGTSFYRYMVRNLVGVLIQIGRHKCQLNDVKEMVIFGKKINYTTVPSCGLYLEKIEY